MLALREVSKRYRGPEGTVTALGGVSLEVQGGELVVVRGPSGCGKTTLLLAAGGLLAPDGGEVVADGESLYRLSPERRARFRAANVGFVFQQFHLVPYLTVFENVLAPSAALPLPDAKRRASDLVKRFGLSERARHLPSELSTGQRQRAALARALLHGPRLLLADEPTGNLDEENARVVHECLKEFAAKGGAVLLVTHQGRADPYADRVISMRDGALARS